jgi:hypothetical protein
MEITLRKANALQNNINDMLKSIQVADSVSLNEFQDAEAVIGTKAVEATKQFHRQVALTKALYDIRTEVANANHFSRITTMLTQVAQLEKLIGFNQKMAERKVRLEAEVIRGKLDKIRNTQTEGRSLIYDRYSEIETGLTTEVEVQSYKDAVAKFKREKQALQDQILEANVSTKVNLSETTANVLRTEGLL